MKKNVPFLLWKKLNELFGQPNTSLLPSLPVTSAHAQNPTRTVLSSPVYLVIGPVCLGIRGRLIHSTFRKYQLTVSQHLNFTMFTLKLWLAMSPLWNLFFYLCFHKCHQYSPSCSSQNYISKSLFFSHTSYLVYHTILFNL